MKARMFVVWASVLIALASGLLFAHPAVAAAHTGGVSFSLQSGTYARQIVTVARGEALVAHMVPNGSSAGSTRIEAFVGGSRVGRVSGSRDEVLRWTLPMDVAATSLSVELRFMCRSKTCRGTAQYTVSTANEAPAPLVSVYVNQRSFGQRSGVCKDANNSTTTDGACMCSDASAAMALVLAGGEDVSDARDVAEDIWEATQTARKPYGGGQVVAELIEAIEDQHRDYSCRETKISSSGFERRLMDSVRMGDPVLLRSKGFSTAGHYVQVLGFKKVGSDLDLYVNDPMGRWLERNRWELNTTSASSSRGQRVTYRLSKLRTDASIIVCTP